MQCKLSCVQLLQRYSRREYRHESRIACKTWRLPHCRPSGMRHRPSLTYSPSIAKPWLHLKKRGFFIAKKGLFNGKKGAFLPSPLPFCDDGIKNFNSPLPLSDDFQCLHSRIIRRLSFGDWYLFQAILPCPMMPAAKVLSLWSLHHYSARRIAEIRFHIHSGFVSCFRREEKSPQRPSSLYSSLCFGKVFFVKLG